MLAELEALNPEVRALKNEVEGLKQRLRLEKDRKRSGSDALKEENESLRSTCDELQAAKDQAQATISELEQNLEAAKNQAQTSISELEQSLENEREARESAEARVDKLKGELSVFEAQISELEEQDIPDPEELERLRSENTMLQRRLTEATSQLTEVSNATVEVPALQAPLHAANQAANGESVKRALEMLDALDRVIDAIHRTDLSGLGTVDRIRLQSALRDTDPLSTINAIRGELSDED